MMLREWLRLKPSGYVHLAIGMTGSEPRLVCGRPAKLSALTSNYPPLVPRCPECVRIAGEFRGAA